MKRQSNGEGVRETYSTEEISGIGIPHVVRMSFELPYLDWCRFEKSEIFRCLTSYLEELEKQRVAQCRSENLVIFNGNKELSPEKEEKILEMACVMFDEDFDEM